VTSPLGDNDSFDPQAHYYQGFMPKKRVPTYGTKPGGSAHPSLSSSKVRDTSHSLSSNGASTGNSVNDQIQKLRLSERASPSSAGNRSSPEFINPSLDPSLPPSVRSLLRLPDAPPPRPRPGLRVTRGRRGPAGPAAPNSWLRGQERLRGRQRISATRDGSAIHVQALPEAYFPQHGSLLETTLKALAMNWDWHLEYDQYYLATIPVRYKEALLHYVAESEHGIDRDGLELLFLDDYELEDATGAEGLTHLNLATSIGHPLKLSDLKALLSSKQSTSLQDYNVDTTPESWDAIDDIRRGPSTRGRFESLTHLSLAQPTKEATWKGLLDVAPYLTTITHFSLAYWPIPTLLPNSKTAYRDTPQGNVNYSATGFYSEYDQDLSEAASLLRRLCKSTYSLQSLDLTGCAPWIQNVSFDEVDFAGAWRALETINISQGWLPACFQPDADVRAWRDILYPAFEDDWTQIRRQLVEWAHIERNTMLLEKAVNERLGLQDTEHEALPAVPQQALETVESDAVSWRSDLVPPSKPPSVGKGVRTAKIKFERGWDSWWIEEAIRAINASSASLRLLGVP